MVDLPVFLVRSLEDRPRGVKIGVRWVSFREVLPVWALGLLLGTLGGECR